LVGPAAAENQQIFERLQNSTGDLNDAFNAYSETTDSKFHKYLQDSFPMVFSFASGIDEV